MRSIKSSSKTYLTPQWEDEQQIMLSLPTGPVGSIINGQVNNITQLITPTNVGGISGSQSLTPYAGAIAYDKSIPNVLLLGNSTGWIGLGTTGSLIPGPPGPTGIIGPTGISGSTGQQGQTGATGSSIVSYSVTGVLLNFTGSTAPINDGGAVMFNITQIGNFIDINIPFFSFTGISVGAITSTTSLGASIRPFSSKSYVYPVTVSGTGAAGALVLDSTGTFNFYASPAFAGFTNSGAIANSSICYNLNG